MCKRQYIAISVLTAAVAALVYIAPPIIEACPLLGAIVGILLLIIMAICIFRGGLTDVNG